MATIDIEIASRRYSVACRDGEEDALRSAAAMVDEKAMKAASAMGTLSEGRQLLLASLMLADQLKDAAHGNAPAPDAVGREASDPQIAETLERLAERMEALADRLEHGRSNP